MKQIIFLFLFTCLMILPKHSSATTWAFSFVSWNGYVYEVTDEPVTDIDKEIGHVTSYSDMEPLGGNFSNTYKKGTMYFSIKGINTAQAIAVQVKDEQYLKAVMRHEQQSTILNTLQNKLFFPISAGLIVLILMTIIIIKRFK
ncbi:hypothetical protein MKZ08_07550 [Viridibacillus sp. FSL R5-0477]|uniref:Uncharacterized protein n=1 Tax=Viridibacillus arenosi FSL R5-213 TaxID=1227360 RepID=W4EXL5_9BACL|nr:MULTISPECIES: hypothetical protein [Viridibacillus]ETT85280.1 hypothetical protein C176_11304 [Viridibacillus arenosi FSL R5-213]OMC80999.1 hypothetical protein BK130_16910 [Viridibacillus sp. FSL H8-0123]OMC86567.1 hypothetical protein BK128_10930 [Viridibacillus sp. FSL H7-0596]OMC89343.1 hypothetical protein BK137_18015 [Viridibacillus arenosi]